MPPSEKTNPEKIAETAEPLIDDDKNFFISFPNVNSKCQKSERNWRKHLPLGILSVSVLEVNYIFFAT